MKKKISSSPIDEIFDNQDKKYTFRQQEIKEYREQAKKSLKKDLNKRLENINIKETKGITKEKRENRIIPYGEDKLKLQIRRIEEGKSKGKFEYILYNYSTKKIEGKMNIKEALTEKEHENILRKKIKEKPFDYESLYVKEDTEKEKKVDKRKNSEIVYESYWRWGYIIYRMKGGRKYEIIAQGNDSGNPRRYRSYQNIIAECKQDVLEKTKITLEEWIYLSKTQPNIYLEGGIKFERFISTRKNGEKEKDRRLDYTYEKQF